jgi:hypothetical protein
MRVWCALQDAIWEYLAAEKKHHAGDAGDPRPCLLDCAGRGLTDAWGHPSGSHRYGDALDFGYFTTGATNRTQQYGPWRPLFSGYPHTDPERLHPERTVRFLGALQGRFPLMRYMVHKLIYLKLLPFMDTAIDMASNVDENPTYNHDKHVHVYLYGFQAMGKYQPGMITG